MLLTGMATSEFTPEQRFFCCLSSAISFVGSWVAEPCAAAAFAFAFALALGFAFPLAKGVCEPAAAD
eukprot:7315426-Pyramimonas_sp.AAC.1